MDRRNLLRLVAAICLAVLGMAIGPAAAADPPKTGFETSNGASWTTHEQELAFLQAVDDQSVRVSVSEIGRTIEDRPLHLVVVGDPSPRAAPAAHVQPTILFVCSQHGNEPAGREACLRWLRDLAFTTDPTLVRQLSEQTILFVPAANPDGRARNTRGNRNGTDINRDHLNLETPEAQAMARVTLDWKPDSVVDLHEFGETPLVYDDELLYLWPRNLNVDEAVRAEARMLAEDYIAKGARANGQRAGEYGRERVPVTDYHIDQIAGDEDEGIARNLFGLRHSAGILLETRVGGDPRTSIDEINNTAAVQRRRVATHYQAVSDTLRFMRDFGRAAMFVSDDAALRKTQEGADRSAPVYFDGQDEDGTLTDNGGAEPTSVADPPPCGYDLTPAQLAEVATAVDLHGIQVQPGSDGAFHVPMAQPAEPVIPLLLDARARRSAVEATPVDSC
jgi:predicted deacylase